MRVNVSVFRGGRETNVAAVFSEDDRGPFLAGVDVLRNGRARRVARPSIILFERVGELALKAVAA